MRWLIVAVAVLALVFGAAALLESDPGYVYIDIGQWEVETTVAFALGALAVLFLALYALLRAVGAVVRSPRWLRKGARGRSSERARRGLTQGLIEMAEGRWEKAEKLLTRHADESDTSLLNYLAAARAAQQAGAYERRDAYLKSALEGNPEADVAVSLTQAELQLAHHQTEHALATLNRLRSLAPHHAYVIKLLARLYSELEDWQRLAELVPELRRRGVFEDERLESLERAAQVGRIAQADQDAEALEQVWRSLPRRMRSDGEVVHEYTRQLIGAGAHETAEKRIRQFLGRQWSEQLVRDYGLARPDHATRQLNTAEGWYQSRAQSPMLLLTLGRLCVRNRLWGKARTYLEASLELLPRAETFYELASLLDELGEIGAAREQYRRGLRLAVDTGSREEPAEAARLEAHQAALATPAPQPVEPTGTA